MKHLPDDTYLQEYRDKINDSLFRIIEKKPELVELIANYHISIDSHFLLLNEMLFDEMKKADKMKALYDDMIEQYDDLSQREIKMIKWIVKHRKR